MASLDRKKLVEQEKLREAFNAFDLVWCFNVFAKKYRMEVEISMKTNSKQF